MTGKMHLLCLRLHVRQHMKYPGREIWMSYTPHNKTLTTGSDLNLRYKIVVLLSDSEVYTHCSGMELGNAISSIYSKKP